MRASDIVCMSPAQCANHRGFVHSVRLHSKLKRASDRFLTECHFTESIATLQEQATNLRSCSGIFGRRKKCILVGTQMLAKGHHLPNVTLVVVVDADSGFMSTDFRAPERVAQLIVQVAGRAGRAERRGEVWIQSVDPRESLASSVDKRRIRRLYQERAD